MLTLHGRPLEILVPSLQPGARLLLLSHDRNTPVAVADLLQRHGFGPSPMTVLAHMGGPDEARLDCLAAEWQPNTAVADFNTIAVDCRLTPGRRAPSRLPGMPDTAFEHDGQMTKQEVRAITLAALAPAPGQMLWDVGAGAGSVAIEWLRADRRNRAIAVERHAERRRMIAANASALGTPGLVIRDGSAPAALEDLPEPDAIFVGGGLTAPGLLDACWPRLAAAGRLVANAVTVEGEGLLYSWHREIGGDMKRVSVSRAEPIGERLGWRPMMSVTQLVAVKP
jgi:precorrin-6Y C5,15-methyltransferase (decarboxylating)